MKKIISSFGLPHELRKYQVDGVRFLSGTSSGLLADEMGLGKTVQTIVAIRVVVERNVSARVLVVAPTALIQNWKDEFSIWAPRLSARMVRGNRRNREACYLLPIPVIIASYEQIRADYELIDYGEKFEIVVLDEAQRIKSPSSSTSIACTTIPRRRSWALSGTPLENVTEDLVSVFSFIRPGILSPELISSDMTEKMSPYFLRRTKKEVLPELPPIIEQDVRLQLSGNQWSAYNKLWSSRRNADSNERNSSNSEMLGLISRLKKICNYEYETGESVKFDALLIHLDNIFAEGEKVIVFSQYVDTLNWLRDRLSHYPHDMYTGKMSNEDREKAVQNFRKTAGPRIFLISIRAGGVGLNLQEAAKVILFDRWWNPSVEIQAIHRAHRFGRRTPLHVIKFLVSDTIEERIEEVLAEKRELFKEYVESAESAHVEIEDSAILRRLLS